MTAVMNSSEQTSERMATPFDCRCRAAPAAASYHRGDRYLLGIWAGNWTAAVFYRIGQ
jgi:hypothetical protein